MLSPALSDALVILGAAGVVIPLFARLRITPVIGFILVGLAVGPYGLARLAGGNAWVGRVTLGAIQGQNPFASLGMVLLLFSGGLELGFDRLRALRREVFGLGALELLVNAALITLGFIVAGHDPIAALALGTALAMSSTALVLRITSGLHGGTAAGRPALAMLLFEDIALVPVIFVLGALAPLAAHGEVGALAATLLRGLLVMLALATAGRWLLPLLFAQAARTKSPELFLAAALLVVIVSALATSLAGFSPIVGAMVAGLLIAGTDYHNEIESIAAPFKGLGLGIFLITVGAGIDLPALIAHWPAVLATTAMVLAVKALVTGVLLRATGARLATATEVGILLASPSETTLIVLAAALGARLITPQTAQFWQDITAIGLIVTPLLAMAGRQLARRIDHVAGSGAALPDLGDAPHAIIVGCGRVGRVVADLLKAHDRPFIGVDTDPDLIALAETRGYPAIYGDAGRSETLVRLGVERASAVILTMDEPVAAQRLVKKLRAQYPALPIIARARDSAHAAQLYRAGASHAVPETLEASLQLGESVLVELGVPMGFVIATIHEKRDTFREKIMHEGGLEAKPKLKSSTLRDRAG
jgi:CPA2 family monovalent cation:H+ antiporter-2